MLVIHAFLLFFFFNDTATTEIYTLSLHDALPISRRSPRRRGRRRPRRARPCRSPRSGSGGSASPAPASDRKSTRLNSSHGYISYAVFCLKKKKDVHSGPPTSCVVTAFAAGERVST